MAVGSSNSTLLNAKAKAARAGRQSRDMGLAGDLGGDRSGKQDLNDEDGKRQRRILPLGQSDRPSLADIPTSAVHPMNETAYAVVFGGGRYGLSGNGGALS